MSETLEQVIADARGELPVLKRRGAGEVARAIEEFITRVATSAHDYLTFVSEKEAMVRSDHAVSWFRGRFPEWERQGNARWNPNKPRERQYRLLIVPVAAQTSAARNDAILTARAEQ